MQVKSKQMVENLHNAVQTIGKDVLNIKAEEIGTHSIRSGAAMAMFLGGLPVYLIMLMGRWSSDAFLRYIRKQIEQFSHYVSAKMIETMCYRYIPAPTESTTLQTGTRDNATTPTMPRRGEMLVAIRLVKLGFLRSLLSPLCRRHVGAMSATCAYFANFSPTLHVDPTQRGLRQLFFVT